jgi:hypothetical protein
MVRTAHAARTEDSSEFTLYVRSFWKSGLEQPVAIVLPIRPVFVG